MNRLRYRIIKPANLIVSQVINTEMHAFDAFLNLCHDIAKDPEYSDDMNMIVDMKKPNYPTNETEFNDQARILKVNLKFDKFVRMICPKETTLKRNYKIFMMFNTNNPDLVKENIFVNNIEEAFTKLGISDKSVMKEVRSFFVDFA